MRHLSVAALFITVYFISQIIPQASDERFYLIQAWWSLLIILIVYNTYKTTVGTILCALEFMHVVLNLVTCVDYISMRYFVYDHYPIILNSINGVEAIVLIIGAPWIGALDRLKSLLSNVSFGDSQHTGRYKRTENDIESEKKEIREKK